MTRWSAFRSNQQFGLVSIILLLAAICAFFGRTADASGHVVNTFLNASTLFQIGTDTSPFAIMAVGMTLVIISGGIDLSVGSTYALAGVTMALLLRVWHLEGTAAFGAALAICLGIGLLCGLVNGLLIAGLKVHPFVITLGTMWIYRGIAFVSSNAESILVPTSLTQAVKLPLKLPFAEFSVYPVPLLVMILISIIGAIFLGKTVAGRYVFAMGGNAEASRYAGLPLNRITVGVYVLSGLCAGVAAFIGGAYFGSASCQDATGYELYVVASAVVGGASLSGGKGNAISAMLGALLIVLMRQSIRTLRLNQNYEWIIIGTAIIVAVVLDRLSQRLAQERLTQRTT